MDHPADRADTVAIRDAATVLLVRDSEAGPQTLMLRRTARAVFGPGTYVFPGGRVDADDGADALASRCLGLDDTAASRALGIDHGGLAFWVAAVRECFEEAGVLIGVTADGDALPATDPGWRSELSAWRNALNAHEQEFTSMCDALDIHLPLDRIHYHSHWVTPPGPPRRFSTRFFATAMPAGATTEVDGSEITRCEWLDCDAALQQQTDGAMQIMPPTEAQLRFLGQHADAASFLQTAAVMTDIPAIAPEVPRFKYDAEFHNPENWRGH